MSSSEIISEGRFDDGLGAVEKPDRLLRLGSGPIAAGSGTGDSLTVRRVDDTLKIRDSRSSRASDVASVPNGGASRILY